MPGFNPYGSRANVPQAGNIFSPSGYYNPKFEKPPGTLIKAGGRSWDTEFPYIGSPRAAAIQKAAQSAPRVWDTEFPYIGSPRAAELQRAAAAVKAGPGGAPALGAAPQQLAPLTGPTPIIMGTRDGVTPDWSQSDQYKSELAQYANTVAGPSKEALGMQIWAQAHPDLAAKVRPGQAGYDVIQKQGIRQPGQPEGVVSMPWSMQKPVLGATNAWNPEQQQPAQVAQPEMGEDRTGSTNERVQAFLNMLTGVGQGR